MDTTVWRYIRWDTDNKEVYCDRCFKSELAPYIKYYHFPDTRWVKTVLGSFRVVALAIEAVGHETIRQLGCQCSKCSRIETSRQNGCQCSKCSRIRRNEWFVNDGFVKDNRPIKAKKGASCSLK